MVWGKCRISWPIVVKRWWNQLHSLVCGRWLRNENSCNLATPTLLHHWNKPAKGNKNQGDCNNSSTEMGQLFREDDMWVTAYFMCMLALKLYCQMCVFQIIVMYSPTFWCTFVHAYATKYLSPFSSLYCYHRVFNCSQLFKVVSIQSKSRGIGI